MDVDHKEGHSHTRCKYENIYSLGDVMNAPNAKTGAAVRKQAPIVAHNIARILINYLKNIDFYVDKYPPAIAYIKLLAELWRKSSQAFDPTKPIQFTGKMKSRLFLG